MNDKPIKPLDAKSIWWGLCASFWYWWDYNVPLFGRHGTAFWHGFHLRDCYNDEHLFDDQTRQDTPREAVATDVSYWEP